MSKGSHMSIKGRGQQHKMMLSEPLEDKRFQETRHGVARHLWDPGPKSLRGAEEHDKPFDPGTREEFPTRLVEKKKQPGPKDKPPWLRVIRAHGQDPKGAKANNQAKDPQPMTKFAAHHMTRYKGIYATSILLILLVLLPSIGETSQRSHETHTTRHWVGGSAKAVNKIWALGWTGDQACPQGRALDRLSHQGHPISKFGTHDRWPYLCEHPLGLPQKEPPRRGPPHETNFEPRPLLPIFPHGRSSLMPFDGGRREEKGQIQPRGKAPKAPDKIGTTETLQLMKTFKALHRSRCWDSGKQCLYKGKHRDANMPFDPGGNPLATFGA
ncbi:hypothetical protein QQ045_001672 [Rhodiola kirilowii]